jgi:AbrB family looped-hinge helix DNA binding protein
MGTTLTRKGQVTIPKHIRDSFGLRPGSEINFVVNESGDLVVRKEGADAVSRPDRFDEVLGTADIKWRTDELMALLRGDD